MAFVFYRPKKVKVVREVPKEVTLTFAKPVKVEVVRKVPVPAQPRIEEETVTREEAEKLEEQLGVAPPKRTVTPPVETKPKVEHVSVSLEVAKKQFVSNNLQAEIVVHIEPGVTGELDVEVCDPEMYHCVHRTIPLGGQETETVTISYPLLKGLRKVIVAAAVFQDNILLGRASTEISIPPEVAEKAGKVVWRPEAVKASLEVKEKYHVGEPIVVKLKFSAPAKCTVFAELLDKTGKPVDMVAFDMKEFSEEAEIRFRGVDTPGEYTVKVTYSGTAKVDGEEVAVYSKQPLTKTITVERVIRPAPTPPSPPPQTPALPPRTTPAGMKGAGAPKTVGGAVPEMGTAEETTKAGGTAEKTSEEKTEETAGEETGGGASTPSRGMKGAGRAPGALPV